MSYNNGIKLKRISTEELMKKIMKGEDLLAHIYWKNGSEELVPIEKFEIDLSDPHFNIYSSINNTAPIECDFEDEDFFIVDVEEEKNFVRVIEYQDRKGKSFYWAEGKFISILSHEGMDESDFINEMEIFTGRKIDTSWTYYDCEDYSYSGGKFEELMDKFAEFGIDFNEAQFEALYDQNTWDEVAEAFEDELSTLVD